MDLEIVKTDTPQRDLLLLADESEESVADYADRGTTYVARRDGEILGVGQIALYERCGFVRCGVDVDYFSKHYPVPFFENGVECRHMVRLRMELK